MARSIFLAALLGLAAFAAAAQASNVVTVSWNAGTVDAACKAANAGKYIYAGQLDVIASYGLSGASQSTIGQSVSVAAGTWTTTSDQFTSADDAKPKLTLCCIPSNPDSGLGNKFRCIPNGPRIDFQVTVTPSGTPAPGGNDGYPSCPADVSLTFVQTLPSGNYLWSANGLSCSGCPGEGTQTAWDASSSQCKSKSSGAGNDGYALCPADVSLTFVQTLPSGKYLWSANGVSCSGCPGEGTQTMWDSASSQCKSTSSGTGNDGYPLCPKDVSLTFVQSLPSGKFLWAADGVKCSGCPAEGYTTVWDATSSTCRSKSM